MEQLYLVQIVTVTVNLLLNLNLRFIYLNSLSTISNSGHRAISIASRYIWRVTIFFIVLEIFLQNPVYTEDPSNRFFRATEYKFVCLKITYIAANIALDSESLNIG